MRRFILAAIACGLLGACASAGPEAVQAGTACSHCRMTVVDARLASQVVARGEEPRFFDDIGCLGAYLRDNSADARWRVYVADHRTGEWVDANLAVYGRDAALATPMGSHLFAHAGAASRSSDASVHADRVLTPADVFGAAGLPGGTRGR